MQTNEAKEAKALITHYIRILFNHADLKYNEDNATELESLIDLVIEAAKLETLAKIKPSTEGIALRDYFAANALQGFISNGITTASAIESSYQVADKMIIQRGKN